MKRYATAEYWARKEEYEEEMARIEEQEREYEMTQEDIDDIKYNEYANK